MLEVKISISLIPNEKKGEFKSLNNKQIIGVNIDITTNSTSYSLASTPLNFANGAIQNVTTTVGSSHTIKITNTSSSTPDADSDAGDNELVNDTITESHATNETKHDSMVTSEEKYKKDTKLSSNTTVQKRSHQVKLQLNQNQKMKPRLK